MAAHPVHGADWRICTPGVHIGRGRLAICWFRLLTQICMNPGITRPGFAWFSIASSVPTNVKGGGVGESPKPHALYLSRSRSPAAVTG